MCIIIIMNRKLHAEMKTFFLGGIFDHQRSCANRTAKLVDTALLINCRSIQSSLGTRKALTEAVYRHDSYCISKLQ